MHKYGYMIKLSKEKTRTLVCPFCGAPHQDIIPSGTVQVKCRYCGGIVLVPPWMSGETIRCYNHPDRLATGICNDCGNKFCESCLTLFPVAMRNERIVLYLCPDCLKERYAKKAEAEILLGLLLAGMGFFMFIVFLPRPFGLLPAVGVGLLFGLIGAAFMLHGYSRMDVEPSEESTLESVSREEERKRAELGEMEGSDFENDYNRLLGHYVNKWGAALGVQTLDSEIAAYVRHGETFPEAVRKILQRQGKSVSSS